MTQLFGRDASGFCVYPTGPTVCVCVYLIQLLVRERQTGEEVKGQVGWAVDRRVPSLCRSGVEYQER
jgi:hypothetical protein